MPRLPVGDTPLRGLRASESSSSPASNRVGLPARRLRGWVREALADPPFILFAPPPGCPQSRLIAARASSRGPRRSSRSRGVRRLQGAGTASPGHVWLSRSRGRLLLTAVPRAGRGGAPVPSIPRRRGGGGSEAPAGWGFAPDWTRPPCAASCPACGPEAPAYAASCASSAGVFRRRGLGTKR